MNRQERLDLARWAVSRARNHGADDAAATLSNSRDIDIEYRDGQLQQLKESTQSSLYIRIFSDQRYSGHTTNDIRRESLDKFIAEAVAMTKYLGKDPYRTLPDAKYYEGRRDDIDLKILDSAYAGIESDRRVAIAREIEEASLALSPKIISCTAYYGDASSESVKVHSNGFEGESQDTTFYAESEVTVDDGQGGRPSDYHYGYVRFFKDLPATDVLANTAVNRALGKIGQTKLPSGIYDMIVENRAVGRFLSGITGAMTGNQLQQRSSFLEGKLDKNIASDKLTLIDDPFIPGGLGSRLYDSDGISARKRVMIEKGVLRQYYIDNYYGKKLGMEINGGSGSNRVLESGGKSKEELIASAKKGILVTRFLGGNSNSTTGDFSYGIVGQLIEDGKIVRPVNEMNISGNYLDILPKLVEVGNDINPYSSWRMGSLHFTDVNFSGV